MLARVYSCAVVDMDATLIEVEVDHENRGLRSFVIVGLPDAAVVESRDRVQAAIKNSGLFVPGHRLTVNLAPANVRKEGPAYDLPIAVGALIASGQLPPESLEGAMVVVELSLDGTVRHVRGILAMAARVRADGFKKLFLPAMDAPQAALVPEIEVIPVQNLSALVSHLNGYDAIAPQTIKPPNGTTSVTELNGVTDFQEVRGQEQVKRALEIAAAGGHNVILSGPPGAGKTLMARALPSILPRLSFEEALDVTHVYSIADQLPEDTHLLQQRPFRAPHHTISHAGLVGGGNWPRPSEISLAHRGVFFLFEHQNLVASESYLNG